MVCIKQSDKELNTSLNDKICVPPREYSNIKSKGIYQPENLISNGSWRHDDAAQYVYSSPSEYTTRI